MKTKKSILWLLGLMLCATPMFTACSDDDDDNKKENPSQKESAKYDDLSVFQNAICRIDSLGHLERYNVGEALYEAEPQHLYIGVDDIEEAANWFRNWIAPDETLGNSTTNLTAQLTDTLGRAQGTIYFKAGTGQTVAEVTYSPETQLKYIDRITFLLNSAWPFNSSGNQWHKGDIKKFHITGKAGNSLDDDDQTLNFVLIREGRNGVKPMWCAITNNTYRNVNFNGWTDFERIQSSSYCPSYATACTISDILCSDWSFFMSKFKEAGEGELNWGSSYWIDHYENSQPQMMVYDRKEISGNSWDGSNERFLLKIDWLNDGERTLTVTNSGTWSITGSGPDNLFDGTCTEIWDSRDYALGTSEVSGKDCWWFEFQADGPLKPKSYTLWTTNMSGEDWIYYARIPAIWSLYGKKNSRSKWVQLDYRDRQELPHKNYASRSFDISNPQEYQLFRFEVYAHWGSLNGSDSPMQLGQLVLNE